MEPITGDGLTAAVYTLDGASFDALRTGKVVALEGGCLGLDNEVESSVLALAKGSSIDSDGLVTAVGEDETSTTFAVGDEVSLGGSGRESGTRDIKDVTYPAACPDDLPVWYAAP